MNILTAIIPPYLIAFLGYISGKLLRIEALSIAKILIYCITPIVLGGYVINMEFHLEYLALPVTIFIVATLVTLCTYILAEKFCSRATYSHIVAGINGMVNTGYLGLPVASALLPQHFMGVYIFACFGLTFHDLFIAYYLFNRQNYSRKKSIDKIIRMPSVYAMLVGSILSLFHYKLPAIITNLIEHSKGAYIFLGMTLLGLAFKDHKEFSFNAKFLSFSIVIRFFLWVCIVTFFFYVDRKTIQILQTSEITTIITLISILPIATNSIAYATEQSAYQEEVALSVLISSLLFVPLCLFFF
jgi:malate permease and related proteins